MIKARPFSSNLPRLGSSWGGAKQEDHALNRTDELDVESKAVHSGQRERAGESGPGSSAATGTDPGQQNKKAKEDHPEAPGPVIGMNDERGGVSKSAVVTMELGLIMIRRIIRDVDGNCQDASPWTGKGECYWEICEQRVYIRTQPAYVSLLEGGQARSVPIVWCSCSQTSRGFSRMVDCGGEVLSILIR
jgi:hypothetical protein